MNNVEKIENELNLACDLTQQIIELASQAELANIEKINAQRLSLIESIFSQNKADIDVQLAKKLFDLNAKVVSTLKNQMSLNMQQQQKFRKGNAAHSAYTNHSL